MFYNTVIGALFMTLSTCVTAHGLKWHIAVAYVSSESLTALNQLISSICLVNAVVYNLEIRYNFVVTA